MSIQRNLKKKHLLSFYSKEIQEARPRQHLNYLNNRSAVVKVQPS